jgi:hypothetical protein
MFAKAVGSQVFWVLNRGSIPSVTGNEYGQGKREVTHIGETSHPHGWSDTIRMIDDPLILQEPSSNFGLGRVLRGADIER